jgi:transposase-like protein
MNTSKSCTSCDSNNYKVFTRYKTKNNGMRELLKCNDCKHLYAETTNTFMFNITTPISKIALVLNARTEGMSFNATCRVHAISTHTLQSWETRFGDLKDILMAYTLSHTFIEMIVEGDELYTKVHKNVPQSDSEGWTLMLMDRASRFIINLTCGKKDKDLFMSAMTILTEVVKVTNDMTLLTDGERRYSKYLFQICYDLLRNDKPGRPKKVLKENLCIKLKNKGSQEHKPGPKLDKYQTPKPEHPNTKNKISNAEIHANHAEGKMRLSVVKTQLIVEKLIRTLKSRMVYNEPLIYTGLYITLYANILQQKRFLL